MSSKIKFTLALAAALAVMGGIGVATGAIPSSDGTITACEAKIANVRYLRPIDTQAGESCKPSEKRIAWNQKGPKGDPGPAGPKGSGLGKIREQVNSEAIAPGQGQANATCHAGEHVIGGGFQLGLTGDEDIRVVSSIADTAANGWVVEAFNNTSGSQEVLVQALCAS